jgi:hypothetical protein
VTRKRPKRGAVAGTREKTNRNNVKQTQECGHDTATVWCREREKIRFRPREILPIIGRYGGA